MFCLKCMFEGSFRLKQELCWSHSSSFVLWLPWLWFLGYRGLCLSLNVLYDEQHSCNVWPFQDLSTRELHWRLCLTLAQVFRWYPLRIVIYNTMIHNNSSEGWSTSCLWNPRRPIELFLYVLQRTHILSTYVLPSILLSEKCISRCAAGLGCQFIMITAEKCALIQMFLPCTVWVCPGFLYRPVCWDTSMSSRWFT